ncbi:MAG: hypothetical protein KF756_11015 [Acidobacteria bacterium]|nr:hypothetical protein [Acidobacteriota bacterium]
MKSLIYWLVLVLTSLGAVDTVRGYCIDLRGIKGDFYLFHTHRTGGQEWFVGGKGEISFSSAQGKLTYFLPDKPDLTAVFALDSDVWVAGDDIYYSMNKGQSWVKEAVEGSGWVTSISCVDSKTCWAVTIDGHILKYDAKNQSWASIQKQTNNALYAVEFRDKNVGWVSGEDGLVLLTSDGGKTWEQQFVRMRLFPDSDFSKSLIDLRYLHIEANGKGWVGGSTGVAFTEDGGRTWRKSHFDGYMAGLVRMPNGKLVAVSLYCENLESDDDGRTWKPFKR